MPFTSFRDFAEGRLAKRHEVSVCVRALRDKVHADLSASALKGTEVLDDHSCREIACAKVGNLLESIDFHLAPMVCSAIASRSPNRFSRAMERLGEHLSSSGRPQSIIGVCENSFFEAMNPGKIELADVDRLTTTIMRLNLKKAHAVASRVVKSLETLGWPPCNVHVEATIPPIGLMSLSFACRIELPEPITLVVGTDLKVKSCDPANESASIIAEAVESARAKRSFGVYYLASHPDQRPVMESKVRDTALGIKAFLPASTALSHDPLTPSTCQDVWKVRLESGSVVARIVDGEAMCETTDKAQIMSMSKLEADLEEQHR